MTQIEQIEKRIEAIDNELKAFKGDKERHTEILNRLFNESLTEQDYEAALSLRKAFYVLMYLDAVSKEAES